MTATANLGIALSLFSANNRMLCPLAYNGAAFLRPRPRCHVPGKIKSITDQNLHQDLGIDQPKFQQDVAHLLVHWPLYRRYEYKGDLRKDKPHSSPRVYTLQLPKAIKAHCNSCAHAQPWDVRVPLDGQAKLGLVDVGYACRACRLSQHYWLLLTFDESGGSIIKVGQHPPLELEPPVLVAAGMNKSDLGLYRHALTCRNSNFGIAAVAYLRRIVENRTNFLIDLVAASVQEEDPTSPLLQRVEGVKRDRRFSEKIDFAADLLPKSIRVGGQNPVSLLHGLTSEALHGLSDEESVDVFDRCQLAFEHVIKRLKQGQDEDRSFLDAMMKMTEKTAKKNSSAS
jgi:hypothetical protein